MSDKSFKYEPVGVREFREKVGTYTEPVTVLHTRGTVKVLGTWFPEGWSKSKSGPPLEEVARAHGWKPQSERDDG